MTGGVVVVLGRTGRNFAAGMSGGIAFVHDGDGQFRRRCNKAMVDLEDVVEQTDLDLLRGLLEKHALYTGSATATGTLEDWDASLSRFIKVMPVDYKRALKQLEEEREASGETA
jgi:glutamate synthase domain-containing protein 3